MKKPIPFGKYYLLDRINVGGMAEVFRAKAFGVEGFERIVAVKRILPSIAEDTEFITMFIDEAKIAVQLNHANIAQIFDLGKVGDSYFIALEYVHGKDLRAIFDLTRKLGEPMPIGMAAYVIMKVCEGLDYAHNKRDASGRDLELVHRDISPQNVILSYDGEVKLIDFGIAKAAGKAGKTQAGILKGKFGYLSPEQVRGENIDRRSDVFGVGIVLYELLTNERLFAGDSDFSTIEKVRNVEIPPPSVYNKKIPKDLEKIVLKALARDVSVRFQTAMELHDELQKFLYARGESFARRDLSAWMRKHFAEDAAGDQEAVGDLSGVDGPPEAERTDVAPILEPAESRAVITETRDAPEQGKPKNKSTILGMPAVLPPADLAGPKLGRSVPPPPPRTASPSSPGMGRSVPPPPPRSIAPAAPPAAAAPAPAPSSQLPTPVGSAPIPSMARTPSIAPAPARSVPPPPPRASVAPPAPQVTPVAGSQAMGALAAAAALEQTPVPAAAQANPVLDMDWDDEELSTQIYDRPEDQLGISGSYEHVDGGFEDVSAGAASQSAVATYVPPAAGAHAAQAMPAVQISPKAYTNSDAPPASLSQPPLSSRAAQVTQPIVTHQASAERNRNPLYAALAVAAVVLLCFVAYVFLVKTEPGVVQLTTHPADATVLFDGKPVGSTSPFVVTGVAPGEKHLLEVQKSGYRGWSQEVQVQPGQTLQFPVTLQPDGNTQQLGSVAPGDPVAPAATGGFSLETTPPGAKVYLDGSVLPGATPMRVANLVPRRYTIRVQMPEYRDYQAELEVRSGTDQALPRVMLQPERVRVRIVSEPSNGEAVVVRGDERRVLGKTPLDVTLENNGTPWTLEVSKNGFEVFRREIAMNDGQTSLSIDADLAKIGGRAPSARAEREPKEPREPRIAAPKETSEGATAAPSSGGGGNGTLRINSRPWSQVYVDGKLIGNTPQMNVSLPEGQHRITLVNPEFNLKKNLTLNIKPGQVETQIVNLQ